MDAQQFVGDADYPNIIDKADDGCAMPGCRGWCARTAWRWARGLGQTACGAVDPNSLARRLIVKKD